MPLRILSALAAASALVGASAAAPATPRPSTVADAPTAGAHAKSAAPAEAALPTAKAPRAPRRRPRLGAAQRLIRRANAAALSAPAAAAFVNATLVYDFEPGRLYRIDASPRFLTTIVLRPGEHLVSKAAGDTVRWEVGQTQQGVGDDAQAMVMIKPVRGGERTNLVLTTDQRSYFLEAVSHEDPTYTSVISWHYPQDERREAEAETARLAALAQVSKVQAAAKGETRAAPVVESGLAVEQLHFGYRIEPAKGRRPPPWTPEHVFDDGARTYLMFPPALATSDAPPLFLIGADGKAQLVNYRVRGAYYIVDRLIDRAELRLGESPQAVVRIIRTGAAG